MKFLALIPARYASTRFPGKPLVDIGGRTMIEHVYNRCSQVFEDCFVATDDDRIATEVKRFGGQVIMTSTEHRSGTDRCAEALTKAEEMTNKRFDIVVNIQGDEPFVSLNQLSLIRSCFEGPDADRVDIATLVKPFAEDEDIFNTNSPKVVLSTNGYALYFSRSVIPHLRGLDPTKWQASHLYYKHIGLYAYRCEVLRQITALSVSNLEKTESLEQLRWLENGYSIKTAVTTEQSHAIDTPQDLVVARQIIALI